MSLSMTDFKDAWRRAEPHLRAALEHGGSFYDLPEVAARLADGRVRLLTGEQSAGVIETFDFPRTDRKALHVWLAGGDLGELSGGMRLDLEAIAEREGCSDILITGRRGWERVLGPVGYAPSWQVLRKRLR
jgi:hypothetical protein